MLSRRKLGWFVRRFLVPSWFVSLYALFKWRASISTRAEVELSDHLSLGRGTTISSFVKLKSTSGPVRIGKNAGFGAGCFIGTGAQGLEVGDNFICGPNTVIVASNYGYTELGVPLESAPQTSIGVRIGNNVWVGANCTILDGSVIPDNCIVAAHSLVNRRFEPNSIIQGNPAKAIALRR